MKWHFYLLRSEEEDQSLKLALSQSWVWSVSDFVFLASAHEGVVSPLHACLTYPLTVCGQFTPHTDQRIRHVIKKWQVSPLDATRHVSLNVINWLPYLLQPIASKFRLTLWDISFWENKTTQGHLRHLRKFVPFPANAKDQGFSDYKNSYWPYWWGF